MERGRDGLLAATEADAGGRRGAAAPVDEGPAHAAALEGTEAADVRHGAHVGEVAGLERDRGAVELDGHDVPVDTGEDHAAVGVVADAVRPSAVVEGLVARRRHDDAPVGGVVRVVEQVGHDLERRDVTLDELPAPPVAAIAQGVEHAAQGVGVDGDEAAARAVERDDLLALDVDVDRRDVPLGGVGRVDVGAGEERPVGRRALARVLHAAQRTRELEHLHARVADRVAGRESAQLAGAGDDDLLLVDPQRRQHVEALAAEVHRVGGDQVELLLSLVAGDAARGDVDHRVGRPVTLAGLDHLDGEGGERPLIHARERGRERVEPGGLAVDRLVDERHHVIRVHDVAVALADDLAAGAHVGLLGLHPKLPLRVARW